MRIASKVCAANDFAMFALIICALAFRISGGEAHEWIGILAIVFFAIHNIINCDWYLRIFLGRYNFKRICTAIFNIALLISAILTIVSGLAFSKYVLSFLHLEGSMFIRQIHTSSAYWTFVIASIHLGIYRKRVYAYMGISKYFRSLKIAKILLSIFSTIFVALGVWAFGQRNFFGKLFLGYSFDFWNPECPSILFFTENILIALLPFFLIAIFSANLKSFSNFLKTLILINK